MTFMPLIASEVLTQFVQDIYLAAGVPAPKAPIAATGLVTSTLRGVDSHGIHLVQSYVDQLLAGELDAQADGHVISEAGSCLLFDGETGLGQWVAEECCRHAVRIA